MACFNTLYPIIRVHIIPPNVDKCDAIHGSNICVSIETIGIHYYESLQYKLIVIVEWVGLNHRVLLTLLPFWLRHLLMRLNMCLQHNPMVHSYHSQLQSNVGIIHVRLYGVLIYFYRFFVCLHGDICHAYLLSNQLIGNKAKIWPLC
eukprot:698072_1